MFYLAVDRFLSVLEKGLAERVQRPAERLTALILPQVPGTWRIGAARALTDLIVRAKATDCFTGAPAGRRVLWCQHPRFAPIAERIKCDLVVYDCMDPHAAFRAGDPRSAELEDRLLRRADVVFAGGHSLAELVRPRREDVLCLPSGIDYRHFASAAAPGELPPELRELRKPVLMYTGAIDERIDWDLIAWLARERPTWSIVLVGPLVLTDRLPVKEPNIHHLGAREYRRLPDYLRGADVCLIPWRVTGLTRYMSPTKTPEYLATGAPVVSTAIPDVIGDYGDSVSVANTKEEFLGRCTDALVRGRRAPEKPERSRTWDEIAEVMRGRVGEALR